MELLAAIHLKNTTHQKYSFIFIKYEKMAQNKTARQFIFLFAEN